MILISDADDLSPFVLRRRSRHLGGGIRRRLVRGSGQRPDDVQSEREPAGASLQMDQVWICVCDVIHDDETVAPRQM